VRKCSLHFVEFFWGVVRELVDNLSVSSLYGVMSFDVFKVLCEDVESEFVLFFGAVASSVGGNEVNELSLGVTDGSG
jgi:hypothetical protein